MIDLPLRIFPAGGLDHSVTTTVMVGILVVAYFNLRLGWPLSGLVVPGYLVPLILAKPWSAAVITIEGVATYWIVWFLSEPLGRLGLWSRFFGRDRFFALILASILVRAFFDAWLLPRVGKMLEAHHGPSFDIYNNLHSFGLIIVALVANQFWKTGLVRGLVPQVVTVSITYCLVRYVLMEYTNFSLARLEYMYEDMAVHFLSAPKAYIILISTAILASRMNLLYGWDFNGILVPSLLALMWHVPSKILATFVEAGVVLVLARLVLKSRVFAGVTVEGSRKIVLFFSASYIYKYILSFAVLTWFPSVKVSDAFGFGYLVSTLLAMRMHDKDIAARMTRTTLECALIAGIFANVAGYGLTLLVRPWILWAAEAPRRVPPGPMEESSEDLVAILDEEKLRILGRRKPDSIPRPSLVELQFFLDGLQDLRAFLENGDPAALTEARGRLEAVGYAVSRVEKRHLLLREIDPGHGWGVFVLRLGSPGTLVIEVPAPAEEALTFDVGVALFEALEARALVVAGSGRRVNRDGTSDVLGFDGSFTHLFHRTFGRSEVLQIRGLTGDEARSIEGLRAGPEELEGPDGTSRLWVSRGIPDSLDLTRLEGLGVPLRIEWRDRPSRNLLRDASTGRFAEMVLNRTDRRRLYLASVPGREGFAAQETIQRIEGYLQERLMGSKERLADRGSDRYIVPSQRDLLFFDDEILRPLLTLVRGAPGGKLDPDHMEDVEIVQRAAQALRYRLDWYRHRPTGQEYLILEEEGPERRFWGTLALRVGPGSPTLVEIPRPLKEVRSLEYGIAFFGSSGARFLSIAGAHPEANRDGSADPLDSRNRANLLQLFAQVITRETGEDPLMVLHCRGFQARTGGSAPGADIILALGDGTVARDHLSPLGRGVIRDLEASGLTVRLADGSRELAGYESFGASGAAILPLPGKEFAIAWISPATRTLFGDQGENKLQESHFDSVEILTRSADLQQLLQAGGTHPAGRVVPSGVRQMLEVYLERQDVVALAGAVQQGADIRFERVIDRNSHQAFLLLWTEPGAWPEVLDLTPSPGGRHVTEVLANPGREGVERFIAHRAAWLRFSR